MSEELIEGEVIGSNAADILAAGMSLASVADRIYKDQATGKTLYKTPSGELSEVKSLRTAPCAKEADTVIITGISHFLKYLETVDTSRAALFFYDGVFTCVLDYFDGPANGEGFKKKLVKLKLTTSEALRHWQRLNRKGLDQEDLANHMEDRLEDVVKPDGATMLDIVNNFHATSEVNFSKVQNLGNGQVKLTYSEDVEAAAGADKSLTIPEEFDLAVPIFEQTVGDTYEHELVRINARFRYRVRRTDLTLTYILGDIEKAKREATAEVFDFIEKSTDFTVFVGAAV